MRCSGFPNSCPLSLSIYEFIGQKITYLSFYAQEYFLSRALTCSSQSSDLIYLINTMKYQESATRWHHFLNLNHFKAETKAESDDSWTQPNEHILKHLLGSDMW